MNIYSQAVAQIIREQQRIIGPLALDQARKVVELKITNSDHFDILGDVKTALTHLVEKYAELFGRASIEVCKEAVRHLKTPLKPEELPEILK